MFIFWSDKCQIRSGFVLMDNYFKREGIIYLWRYPTIAIIIFLNGRKRGILIVSEF